MAKNYSNLAKIIIEKLGGEQNINSLIHCATRLRFNLKDEEKADTKGLKNTEDVIDVVQSGGQYQIVIGPAVADVYKAINEQSNFSNGNQSNTVVVDDGKGKIARILDTIAGMFVPIVPVMAGAGMIKVIVSLASMFGWLTPKDTTFQFLSLFGDSVFYFLPVILAVSAAKKFKTNQYLAMTVGAAIISPVFVNMVTTARTAGSAVTLFGLPVTLATYSSSVIPIILAVWFLSYVEPIVSKYTPVVVRIFLAPMITLLIVLTATFIVIGPIGAWLGDGLNVIVVAMNGSVPWLVPLLVGATTPLIVMTGMHYGIIPIGINMLATKGIDTVAGPGMMVSNIAQGGAALALAFKTKDKSVKGLTISTGISAILGITEPVLYGVNLKYKRPLYAAMFGGGVAGLYLGLMGVGRFAQVPPGLLSLPSYFSAEAPKLITYATIACFIAFITSFVASFILGLPKEDLEIVNSSTSLTDDSIVAVTQGKLVPLEEVNDKVFSSKAMGDGIAIYPEIETIVSPVNGEVVTVFPTGHAYGIARPDGVEVLVHIGINTVDLAGEGFTSYVKQGDVVTVGKTIAQFDRQLLLNKGYDPTIMTIITDSKGKNINFKNKGNVFKGDLL
ncbi:beta-glucoside-specific PTS transporter subunit IIABC [Streptococcus parauberis]|uniref:beta-glucoside-specific PTS transporter subunit IIABC n=1 Tax=Streptococcus parauberis TaxID=1348 RepID=UPI002891A901|nr:beta-glucoside-specific PTS transporter subunit IIABC [Streptococcus parauberis]MDT2750084.1 beta-glucoside-specific PTS transporter subunit IIABC [Streptococcus parauberis]